jgi:hypothetical protein
MHSLPVWLLIRAQSAFNGWFLACCAEAKARSGRCGSMNAVNEAFTAGAAVVVAGETHGQLNRDEEIGVWQASGITVCKEEDLLPIAGKGAIKGMRFDSPFMCLLACANDVSELVTGDNLASWIADKEKSRRDLLVNEMLLFKEVGGILLGYLRDELTATEANLKTSLKLKKAELVNSYISSIADSLNTHNQKVGYLGELSGVSREVPPNVEVLAREIGLAIPIESSELARFANNPKMARSASMLVRLVAWGQHVSTPTIWKVGEAHITDMLRLTNGQPVPKVRLMDSDEYLTAFSEQLKANPKFLELHNARRFQDTQQFFADKPLDPLVQYMADKGWLRLLPASSVGPTKF